jgi:hypothetical protein
MTELEAANRALTMLGLASITALDQDIQAARVISSLFAQTAMAVLAEFPWSFALEFAELEEAPPGTDLPRGWNFAWVYPAAAALYRVYGTGRAAKIDYVTANGFIFTREPGAWAEYTNAGSDVSGWPALASEAFVIRLAAAAAPALAGSPQLGANLLQQYVAFVELAKGNSMNDERVARRSASRYVDVRH